MLALGAPFAAAQNAAHTAARDSLEAQLQTGVRALEADQPIRAETLFADVFAADPGYVSPQHGAAAYWLGTAQKQQNKTERARRTWRNGQQAVAANDTFDIRLADAYLRTLFATDLDADRLNATQLYLDLLRRAGTDLAPPEVDIVRRRAAQTAVLMREDERAEISDQALHDEDEAWTLKPGAGDFLIAWWKQQDAAPATPENERLEEHLQRVAAARAQYAHDERPSGLDDRGETYLRYGPPYQQRAITYDDAGFHLDVFRFGVNVTSFDFPKNEIWTYPRIHHAAYFIFVEEDDHYYIGSSSDLLPDRLTNTFTNSGRHLNRAVSALAAMQYIFRDLALYHPDFSHLYTQIANYADWQEMKAAQFEATGRVPPGTQMQRVGMGVGQEQMVFSSPVFGFGLPSEFVQRTASEQKTLDYHAQRIRKKELPPQSTRIFDDLDPLPVTIRTARFLEPDGQTRTEVYWGTFAQQLRLDEEHAGRSSLVKLTAVEYGAGYDRSTMRSKWYNTSAASAANGLAVPGAFSIKSAADRYHLGLQWEQYTADLSGSRIKLDEQLRVATHRIDTLAALNAAPDRLEMSDLKPMVPDESFVTGDTPLEAAPYPFDQIAPDASLMLYFELYHLGFTGEDRTRYTVAYDVTRRTERGRISGLFRGDKEDRTTASTTYEGSSRTTEEQILIDLSDWEAESPGALTVTVRVTDEVTGQQVARSISFDVGPRDE